MSEALKLARLQRDNAVIQEIFDVIKHPIFSVLIAFTVIEYLQSVKVGETTGWFGRKSEKYAFGENIGTMLEAGIIAAPVLTSLANSGALSEMVKVPGDVLKSVSSLLPALPAVIK